MFAIRAERDYVIEEDFMKAVRKMGDQKKLEGTLEYKSVWNFTLIETDCCSKKKLWLAIRCVENSPALFYLE